MSNSDDLEGYDISFSTHFISQYKERKGGTRIRDLRSEIRCGTAYINKNKENGIYVYIICDGFKVYSGKIQPDQRTLVIKTYYPRNEEKLKAKFKDIEPVSIEDLLTPIGEILLCC